LRKLDQFVSEKMLHLSIDVMTLKSPVRQTLLQVLSEKSSSPE